MPEASFTPFVQVSDEVKTLSREIAEKIARLRVIAVDPVDIAYGEELSFEVRPNSDNDRLMVFHKDRGFTNVNYTHEGLILDVYPEGLLPECVHTASIFYEDLVDRDTELLEEEAQYQIAQAQTQAPSSSAT